MGGLRSQAARVAPEKAKGEQREAKSRLPEVARHFGTQCDCLLMPLENYMALICVPANQTRMNTALNE
jgi:hypothetical protein